MERNVATPMLTAGQAGAEVHPLHYAAAQGDLETVKQLLSSGATDIDSRDVNGRTALMYAVSLRDGIELVNYLLALGANLHAMDNEGQTALHWAASHGRHRALQIIVDRGAAIDQLDSQGRSVLHLCSSHRSMKCFRILRKVFTQPGAYSAPDASGMTPLHWAAHNNSRDHCIALLDMQASVVAVDNEGKTALHWAALVSDATSAGEPVTNDDVVLLLLEAFNGNPAFVDAAEAEPRQHLLNAVDVEGRSPLHIAIGIQNTRCCLLLLGQPNILFGAQDNTGRTPLHWAVQTGNVAVVNELLLLGGTNLASVLDANGWSALHYAAHDGVVHCAEALLHVPDVSKEIDAQGQTPLHLAAMNGNVDIARVLLDAGSDVNALDATGNTPIHSAAFAGHSNLCQILIERGSALDTTDNQGQTPAMYACEQGHVETLKILAHMGADFTRADHSGQLPLHFAAIGGNTEVIEYLVGEYGCDPNARDENGRTALHTAVYSADSTSTEALIKCGANVNAQDNAGICALHWAASRGAIDCLELLLAADAFPNHTEYHEERLTPVDYATMSEQSQAAALLQNRGGLSITEVRELAANHIQSWWNGYQTRINILAAWSNTEAGKADLKAHGEVAARLNAKDRLPEIGKGQKIPKGGHRASPTKLKTEDPLKNRPSPLPIPDQEPRREPRPPVPKDWKPPPILHLKPKPLSPPLTKPKRVTVHNRVSLAPDRRKKQKKPPRTTAYRGAKGKAPHHLPTLRYYLASVEAERDERIAQAKFEKASADPEGSKVEPPQELSQVQKERRRLHIVRAKVEAARIIQSQWRLWIRRGRPRAPPPLTKFMAKSKLDTGLKRGQKAVHASLALDEVLSQATGVIDKYRLSCTRSDSLTETAIANDAVVVQPLSLPSNRSNREMQIAALTIQLAWRQYLTRTSLNRGKTSPLRVREKVYNPWSPEVLAHFRSIREERVYTQRITGPGRIKQWKPKLKKKIRPPAPPSIAVTAFNLAYNTYSSAEFIANYEARQAELNQLSSAADEILKRTHKRRIDKLRREARGKQQPLHPYKVSSEFSNNDNDVSAVQQMIDSGREAKQLSMKFGVLNHGSEVY